MVSLTSLLTYCKRQLATHCHIFSRHETRSPQHPQLWGVAKLAGGSYKGPKEGQGRKQVDNTLTLKKAIWKRITQNTGDGQQTDVL